MNSSTKYMSTERATAALIMKNARGKFFRYNEDSESWVLDTRMIRSSLDDENGSKDGRYNEFHDWPLSDDDETPMTNPRRIIPPLGQRQMSRTSACLTWYNRQGPPLGHKGRGVGVLAKYCDNVKNNEHGVMGEQMPHGREEVVDKYVTDITMRPPPKFYLGAAAGSSFWRGNHLVAGWKSNSPRLYRKPLPLLS
ncbi:hypothetical protein F503_05066 [Ophiostoma piceae UAMH 11346]|uniref:Uncharacterized protein n=1 Tax=Ophiostoma piceae (strain UAMH 11346) TaxID=1262450 RepID=S3CD77_OPHP1|nr:hypothetical protein F503_05066 [Ophiostoma piceae UAMH 11346]